MLIHEKLPQGAIYPQLTQAPISTYADFLNFSVGRVAQPFGPAGTTTKWVPRSCVLCKGGYHGHLQWRFLYGAIPTRNLRPTFVQLIKKNTETDGTDPNFFVPEFPL